MKFLIAAAALVIAAPVAAQTAPAAHAEHEEHRGEKHEGEHKGCCEDGTMACCKPDAGRQARRMLREAWREGLGREARRRPPLTR
jgi:Spy/CpxP family protein refolding chaperone